MPGGGGGDEDLPPSYEDAMADDLAPVDGPRPSGFGLGQEQRPAFNPDSKSSDGLNRRVSERLFAQNAPRAPRSAGSRSSRVASGDLSRFSDDVVHEEPDDMDYLARDMQRHSLGHTGAFGDGFDYDADRPVLPNRKSDSNGGGFGSDIKGKKRF